MKTIAIANQKGGVGKTTTAVNLGHCLAARRKGASRVLIVDLDAQANSTTWLIGDGHDFNDRSAAEVILREAEITDCIVKTPFTVDLLPGHIAIASLDLDLSGEINPDMRLKKSLERVAHNYDYVLIDCPPSLGIATINALTAADVVIVAIQTHSFPFEAVSRLMNTLRKIVVEYSTPKRILALPTMFDRTVIARSVLEEIQTKFEHLTLTPIHKNTRLAEAVAARKPITVYDPTSIGALDYQRLAKEIVDGIGQAAEAEVRGRMEEQ